MSREEILTSIRANLAASTKFDELHEAHRHDADHTSAAIPHVPLSQLELTELFRNNLESVRGSFVSVASRAEAVVAVQKIIDEIRPARIVVSHALNGRSRKRAHWYWIRQRSLTASPRSCRSDTYVFLRRTRSGGL